MVVVVVVIFVHEKHDQASHSGGSSGRSRSATPDSLDTDSLKTSTENLIGEGLTISPAVSPKTWSRSGSQDDGEHLSNRFQSSCLNDDDAATISSNKVQHYLGCYLNIFFLRIYLFKLDLILFLCVSRSFTWIRSFRLLLIDQRREDVVLIKLMA